MKSEHLLPTSALDRLARFHFFGLWSGELRKGMIPLLDPPKHLYSPLLKKDGAPPVGGEQEGEGTPAAIGQAEPTSAKPAEPPTPEVLEEVTP